MQSLLLKEIRQFFSGPAAYLVPVLFYIANALMLFVLPTGFNIFDAGYATLEPFFAWVPWVFLFLIPAVCMRTFSEEKKTGTMEVLLTRPLSVFRIVLAKYGACFFFLLLSLLPTFVYLYTVSALAQPVGNVDTGAFWGAFLGLLLLGSAFTAFCIFMSSLTDNQVVAFVLSAVGCAVLYEGFELFGAMSLQGGLALGLSRIGIRAHYVSLSRGVIDLRDVVYYLGLIVIFVSATVWRTGVRTRRKTRFCAGAIAATAVLNIAVSFLPLRLDLTADKRYTLLPLTKEILRENDKPVLVNVYLTGDLPAGFKRLEKSVRETLDEFRVYHPALRYRFVDIYASEDEAQRQAQMRTLAELGVQPTQLEVKTKAGVTRRLVFPVAEVRAEGKSLAVPLLGEQMGRGAEETLNNSVENVELQLINAVRALFTPSPQKVAFLEGNGEAGFLQTVSLGSALSVYYQVSRQSLTDEPGCLLTCESSGVWKPKFDVLLVVRPTERFDEGQKYVLDQYIMHGGKILWLIEAGNGSLDSLRGENLFDAMPLDLNLEDMFFRYGFRVRSEMLLDKNAAPSPVVTGYMGSEPLIEFIPNYYCPLVEMYREELPADKRVLAYGLGPVRLQVAAGLDTIANAVSKTVLLHTSDYSYRIRLPHAMSADLMRDDVDLRRFREKGQTTALLLEGEFPTAYPLVKPALRNAADFKPRKESSFTRMIVAGDGDLACNEWLSKLQKPLPLGMDRYTGQMYANGDFLMNAVHYLCDNPEYTTLKPRSVKMRLLDKAAMVKGRRFYTLLNFALPLACVLLFGLVFIWNRKRKYAR